MTLLIYKEETYVIMIACDIALCMKGNMCCYNSMCHCLIQGGNYMTLCSYETLHVYEEEI
jgi:hypothetical protein